MSFWVGWQVAGLAGGIVATFALILPSILLMTIFIRFFWSNADNPYLKGAASGAGIAVIGLLAYVTYDQAFKIFTKNTEGNWLKGLSAHLDWVAIVVIAFARVVWRPSQMMPLVIAGAAIYGAFFLR
jgi:chromate transporter